MAQPRPGDDDGDVDFPMDAYMFRKVADGKEIRLCQIRLLCYRAEPGRLGFPSFSTAKVTANERPALPHHLTKAQDRKFKSPLLCRSISQISKGQRADKSLINPSKWRASPVSRALSVLSSIHDCVPL
jgi:hypothetical protein